MRWLVATFLLSGMSLAVLGAPAPGGGAPAGKAWVERSNTYTNRLLAVQFAHDPERGSSQGVATFDERISDPGLADELAERKELEAVLATIQAEGAKETDKRVQEDLEIVQKTFDLQFRQEDYRLQHKVPFYDASAVVFRDCAVCWTTRWPAERRPAAVVRLRKYAGVEPGFKPFTELLKQRVMEQMAKPGVVYPVAERDGDGAGAGQELRRRHRSSCS